MATFIGKGFSQTSATALRNARANVTCGAADAAFVREREDPLGARIDRLVYRMPEAGHPPSHLVDRARDSHRIAASLEQPRTLLGRAEDDGAGAEDARRDRALQGARVCCKGHPRGDIARHQSVLGDCHEQHVEEEALVLRRLTTGEQEVEVLGKGQPAQQVAGEIASPHFDPVGIGLADVADRRPALTAVHVGDLRRLDVQRSALIASRERVKGAGRPR
jgi:hypothetical protein